MKAILREDLAKLEVTPPYISLVDWKDKEVDWSIAYESCQPDVWDYDEFNMLLFHPEEGLIQVNTIDFDFVDDD